MIVIYYTYFLKFVNSFDSAIPVDPYTKVYT